MPNRRKSERLLPYNRITPSRMAANLHIRLSAQLRDPMPYRQSNMGELSHANEALYHFLSPQVSLTHPAAQEHIS